MVVMAPKDFSELESMLEFACFYDGPIAIRYPRGGESNTKFKDNKEIKLGKGEIIVKGSDITIVAIGKMVAYAYEVANKLKDDNISVEVINARFAKQFDKKLIDKSVEKTKLLVTIEDNNVHGGFGETLDSELNYTCKTINFGYPDEFIKHGSVDEIEKKYGLDVNSIYERIKKEYNIVK
jgi:1-deoxy-D-xylulose-5-phosphate synthase